MCDVLSVGDFNALYWELNKLHQIVDESLHKCSPIVFDNKKIASE